MGKTLLGQAGVRRIVDTVLKREPPSCANLAADQGELTGGGRPG